jgi:hypothetical protein
MFEEGKIWSASVVVVIATTLAVAGCATTASTTSPQASTALRPAPARKHHRRHGQPLRSRTSVHRLHRATPTRSRPPLTCPARGDVLAGVYHPYRLHVLASCRSVSGTVKEVRHEEDGDLHIYLDTGGALTNSVNGSAQSGSLVVEFMARDGGHLPAPNVGDHISLTGAWVLDTDHGWNELHPVWSETLNGATYHSGPQYGGSPAGANSSEAAAACQSNGAPCRGYGGGSPSSIGGSSTPSSAPASHLRSGEFCATSKEAFYEANGYTCSPGSDGRERLHTK